MIWSRSHTKTTINHFIVSFFVYVCSLATAAVEFRRFSFNRKLGRFDQPARILHSNCLIFRHFSSHHHQYWPILYFRFLYICGHFHRTTAFLSKLIFFHTIIEWFKNVMPIQLLFLTQFFLNNYYLLRIVNGHHVEFFFGIIFFFAPPGVCEWIVLQNKNTPFRNQWSLANRQICWSTVNISIEWGTY